MALEDAKKAVSTVDLVLQGIGLLKTGALIFGMMLIEWARAKQRMAENEVAVAQAEADIAKKKEAIDAGNVEKSSDAIVDDFLHGSSPNDPSLH